MQLARAEMEHVTLSKSVRTEVRKTKFDKVQLRANDPFLQTGRQWEAALQVLAPVVFVSKTFKEHVSVRATAWYSGAWFDPGWFQKVMMFEQELHGWPG